MADTTSVFGVVDVAVKVQVATFETVALFWQPVIATPFKRNEMVPGWSAEAVKVDGSLRLTYSALFGRVSVRDVDAAETTIVAVMNAGA